MELGDKDFTRLMSWLGPAALQTHRTYPRGQRYFDTESRTFRFNIDPNDYFQITPGVEGVSPPKIEGVVRAAYLAMQTVIKATKKKSVKSRIVRISAAGGGSYIEAIFPPKG